LIRFTTDQVDYRERPLALLEIGFERDEFIREWLCNLGIGEAPSSGSHIATFATLRAHGKVM
jgi:hypothetical protein